MSSIAFSTFVALALLLLLEAISAQDGPVVPKVRPVARPFPLAAVKLLDSPFSEAMKRNGEYLLSLDADRLLHTFRLNAGLPSTAQPLGGWEAPNGELRGHSMGHYLSACAWMYSSSGDARFKERIDYLVAELGKCQEALPKTGANHGFLSAFPESFIDRVEACKPVWAPYYTLHKIMAGLLDAHRHCGNRQALGMLVRMADWVKFRMDRLEPGQIQAMLGCEFGGMNDVLAGLYAETGNLEHLRMARAFDHQVVFEPLARGEDRLDGLHANTQIPKAIGAALEYELTGETRYRDIATNFWKYVALDRSYAIGGHGDREHFFPVKDFARHLSPETAETCNTYNMLKLTRHLFGWEPSSALMDFYERALYNHILASQDPKQAMFVYLMSLKPGHFKTYSTPLDSFWCCVGTGMENHARYADTIFFQGIDTLYVNLFIPAELSWKEMGLTVRQETRFPENGTVTLSLKATMPVALTIQVRRPVWAKDGFAIAVNGREEAVSAPGSYVALKRTWKDGDRVEVRLPMELRTECLPGNPRIVAFLYGPVVLAGELGTAGIAPPMPYAHGQTQYSGIPSPEVPVLVADDPNSLPARLEPAGAPMAFRTKDLGKPAEVSLIPFYRLHHQRYTVYWQVLDSAGYAKLQAERAVAEERRKEREARRVDAVAIGDRKSESDHGMLAEKSEAGMHALRAWRHALDGGYFSYRLNAKDAAILVCTYWGGDGNRTFDILVDGKKLATQKLESAHPDRFFDVEYPLPEEMVKDKDWMVVRFEPHRGSTAGGIFGCEILKKR